MLSRPADGGVAGRVAQRGQHRDQRGQRVRSRAAVHPRVSRAGHRPHRHQHRTRAAQAGRDGGSAELDVAGVGDEHHVGREQVRLRADQPTETALRHLFRALAHHADADRPRFRKRAQGGEQHDEVALAVGGAAAVEAAVALGQLPGRRAPVRPVAGRLHVVVGVEQHRRRALRPGRVPDDRVAAVVGGHTAYAGHAGVREQRGHGIGGGGAGLLVRAIGHRRHRDQTRQVVECTRQQPRDRFSHVSCSRYSGSISHHVGQSWS